ncbi:hypothetical protein METH_18060 [Leisingera methylohalidivorans DSM 14336]|uniref:Uncharacterized protein n=1 Tax=Leisingera methylohalidivorans DSM 14336 TaxID=999552 RepID=V9VY45_9RHOB|nr:hypothetical protein METH_00335 [Leisingera methylohalidivorans DSM 14336]AHD02863.1 hypothetical protein METH_03760 [Leisingera methylohalidivorans DSM 14336]AHD03275.1 hypothetical protein METH_18060 [Leisingera methylohalidivorans DSM 14336]
MFFAILGLRVLGGNRKSPLTGGAEAQRGTPDGAAATQERTGDTAERRRDGPERRQDARERPGHFDGFGRRARWENWRIGPVFDLGMFAL